MVTTTLHFEAVPTGLSIEAKYDTGWHKELNCSGVGGWQDVVPYKNGTASVEFRSTHVKGKACVVTATESSNTVTMTGDFDGSVFTKLSEVVLAADGQLVQTRSAWPAKENC